MTDIRIKQTTERDRGWHIITTLNGSEYHVTVDESYHKTLTGGSASVEELARASFEFLLDHEPLESITREFDLSVIPRYFPDYEESMQKRFGV